MEFNYNMSSWRVCMYFSYVSDVSFQIIHVTLDQKIRIQLPMLQITTTHNSKLIHAILIRRMSREACGPSN
jgi:hypothetical protein